MNRGRLSCSLLVFWLIGGVQVPAQQTVDRKAFEELKAKVEKGDAAAQYELGKCFDEGRGVSTNHAEAVQWFRKAAEKGHTRAQFNLGLSVVTDEQFALAIPSSSQPVTAAMKSTTPEVRPGETFEILVRMEIAGAHHIYASNVVGKPFIPTTLDVTLPRGVEALGNWIGPEPTRRKNGELIYTDSALFRRRLKVRANVPTGPLSIKGELHYQACTEELCWPPRTIQLSSSISVHSPKR